MSAWEYRSFGWNRLMATKILIEMQTSGYSDNGVAFDVTFFSIQWNIRKSKIVG